MTKESLRNACIDHLSTLTDAQIVDAVLSYFHRNKTLPGERSLREYALSLKEEFTDGSMTGLLPDIRMDFIRQFANIAVKETKLKNILLSPDQAADLPMVLFNIGHRFPNTVENQYALLVAVQDQTVSTVDGRVIGQLRTGFYHNFKESLKTGFVLVTDYSNEKFRNLSYTFLADLSAV